MGAGKQIGMKLERLAIQHCPGSENTGSIINVGVRR